MKCITTKNNQPNWMKDISGIQQGVEPGCPGGSNDVSNCSPGLPGPQGPQGPPGPHGEPGKPGEAATINIGATTTVPFDSKAKVTNTGTEQDAVLNFEIPSGSPGPMGPKGNTGITGQPGQNAEIYIYGTEAVPYYDVPEVVNMGTEALANLLFKIPQGHPGSNGIDGVDGAIGPEGPEGIQGPQGYPGNPGKNGTSATITIGTVKELPSGAKPTVTNSGTVNDAIFNFGFPRCKKQKVNLVEIEKGIVNNTLGLRWSSAYALNPEDQFVSFSAGFMILPIGEYRLDMHISAVAAPVSIVFNDNSNKLTEFKTGANHLSASYIFKSIAGSKFHMCNNRGTTMEMPANANNKYNITITQISDI